MSTVRLAVPRAGFQFHSQQLLLRQRTSQLSQQQQHLRASWLQLRSATTNTQPAPRAPPKPRVLEQPDRFRPPSHPQRIRPKPRYAGPPLSEHERQAQTTRQYPHMMPPEGTFLHWFLKDRVVHVFITMGILLSLVFGIYFQDFLHKTPYRDLLPPNSLFFAHPVTYLHRWWTVYDMHVSYISAQTAERRKAKADDVVKRSEYRKAHGLETEEKQSWFGGWTAREDGPRKMVPKEVLRDQSSVVAEEEKAEKVEDAAAAPAGRDDVFVAFDGSVQAERKKWFGLF